MCGKDLYIYSGIATAGKEQQEKQLTISKINPKNPKKKQLINELIEDTQKNIED